MQTHVNGTMRDCCANLNNRRIIEKAKLDDDAVKVTEECAVCERKHYFLSVPPVKVGVTGAAVGG